jgi:Domain of unknown function (DUF3854)
MNSWENVTAENPCKECGKGDWCSTNGTYGRCNRTGDKANRTDKDGAPYYLFRLDGQPIGPRVDVSFDDAEPAPGKTEDPDTLHQIYADLQASLTLSDVHREALRKRGLTDEQIDLRGYRTLPAGRRGRQKIAEALHQKYGSALFRVPGFYFDKSNRISLAGAAGILIPVYGSEFGYIRAFKIRRDEAVDGQRYRWLSSNHRGGPGPGSLVHWPIGISSPAAIVRVTEGPLKADIATALSGLPTIAIPGVGTWKKCIPVLRELRAETVRLAFDADARTNPTVARSLKDLAAALQKAKFTVELESWSAEQGKGIDDLLDAGGNPEVLASDGATKAIQEIADAAGVVDVDHDKILSRLTEVVGKGPETFFQDADLLRSLAHFKVNDPARFAVLKAEIKKANIPLDSLREVLKREMRNVRNAQPMPIASGECYRVVDGRICQVVSTPNGQPVEIPLANFNANITQTITRDDGVESWTVFGVQGEAAGDELHRVYIRAGKFASLDWVSEEWAGKAIIYAGAGKRDHLRAAIETLSKNREFKTEYTHTGWREFNGQWYFLHAGGAVGQYGPVPRIDVFLPDNLSGFRLPDSRGDPREAVQASLRLLDLGPDRITLPILAGVYRAVLGGCDFSLFLAGATGVFKTEFAALAQRHFGAGLDARHLPGNWSSTANALEILGFTLKDCLYVVDDFAPSGSATDVLRLHREADRLLRGQGNATGRQRLNRDCTARPDKRPRGLPLATGEDLPNGHSLRARMLTVDVGPDDIKPDLLTLCQKDAAAGLYAKSLAGFIQWLAPNMKAIAGRLRQEVNDRRAAASSGNQHARTPEIAGNLGLGLRYFLEYAVESKAITAAQSSELSDRGWRAILEVANAQAEKQQDAEPTEQFFRRLCSAIDSRRCHIAGSGDFDFGRPIGWKDGESLYLDPEAAYAEVQGLSREQGNVFPVSLPTLMKRMREKDLLVSCEDGRATVRKVNGVTGKRCRVLHVAVDALAA